MNMVTYQNQLVPETYELPSPSLPHPEPSFALARLTQIGVCVREYVVCTQGRVCLLGANDISGILLMLLHG